MPRLRISLNTNIFIDVRRAENGVIITSPDYREGYLILEDQEDFEEKIEGIIADQKQKALDIFETGVNEVKDRFNVEEESFDKDVQEIFSLVREKNSKE